MTGMTVLHIASPFAVSMPMPERVTGPIFRKSDSAVAGSVPPDTGDTTPSLGGSGDAAAEGGSAALDPRSRETVLRRYIAFGGVDTADETAGTEESQQRLSSDASGASQDHAGELTLLGSSQSETDQQGGSARVP